MAASFIYRNLLSQIASIGCKVLKDRVHSSGPWRNFITTGKRSKDIASAQNPGTTAERDPFPVFLDKKVQEILYQITGFDALKIAGPHKKPLEPPVYKLLTDEELAQELQVARDRLRQRLQIPPYMNPRTENLPPLSVDPDLAGHDTSKYVFTDISFGVNNKQRSVVIREMDGTLKVAPGDVKDRMNHIYFPREGSEYFVPKMFQEHNLERMISEKRYLYILDRACCQFEPDDSDFIRVTHRVFNAIHETREFDVLRSTRHFGSLAFYLAWYQMIDYLLLDMVNRDLVSDAQALINLYCIIHPTSKCAVAVRSLGEVDAASVVKTYTETESKNKAQLELALQAMEDARRTKEKV